VCAWAAAAHRCLDDVARARAGSIRVDVGGLRTHVRAGASFAVPALASQRVDGTIAEWETWTGLTFPDSGDYVVEGALIPVSIDRAADRGTIVEPNYWMRHPIR